MVFSIIICLYFIEKEREACRTAACLEARSKGAVCTAPWPQLAIACPAQATALPMYFHSYSEMGAGTRLSSVAR